MKALVTGGAGFVGRHLAERLVKEGNEVVVVDLPNGCLDGLDNTCGETRGCDLCDFESFGDAFSGVDVVFHIAAFASPWGAHEKFWAVNVNGTENVIRACKEAGVKRLVAVSSTSAVFDGKSHHNFIDETAPYPTKFLSPYSSSKSVSERLVLAANCSELETTVVRPHLIWGPRDQTFLTRFLEHTTKRSIPYIGKNTLTDTTYVDNLVEGLVLASTSDKSPGNVYFITNGEQVKYGDFMDKFLEMFECPPAKGNIPTPVAKVMAYFFEGTWLLFKFKSEPLLARYKLAELIYNHTYKIDKAKRDLGYEPIVSNEEGYKRVREWALSEGMVGK